jgi:hypothetical protein
MLGDLVRYTLPRALSSTSELLDSEGMFLLDDGRYMYLYIGRNVPGERLQELFNIDPRARPEVKSELICFCVDARLAAANS